MHRFYFNECLPLHTVTLNDFVSLLINTIKEYESLIKKDIGVDKGIILEKEAEKIIVCGSNLKETIKSIPDKDRETRTLAYAYFTKYPIQDYLQSKEIEDQVLEEEYFFEDMDATNLAIVKHNNCFLFSEACHKSIKNNILRIKGKSTELAIDNLYGEEQNTQYIEYQIRKINSASLKLIDQLKAELKSSIYTSAFEKAFLSETEEVQKSIIEMFLYARDRKLATPYYPDTKIISDVTPDDSNKKARVYELRVYRPKALRVYFFEYMGTVYIAKMEYKSSYKEENRASQAKDIKRALDTIDNMIKMK